MEPMHLSNDDFFLLCKFRKFKCIWPRHIWFKSWYLLFFLHLTHFLSFTFKSNHSSQKCVQDSIFISIIIFQTFSNSSLVCYISHHQCQYCKWAIKSDYKHYTKRTITVQLPPDSIYAPCMVFSYISVNNGISSLSNNTGWEFCHLISSLFYHHCLLFFLCHIMLRFILYRHWIHSILFRAAKHNSTSVECILAIYSWKTLLDCVKE